MTQSDVKKTNHVTTDVVCFCLLVEGISLMLGLDRPNRSKCVVFRFAPQFAVTSGKEYAMTESKPVLSFSRYFVGVSATGERARSFNRNGEVYLGTRC